MSKGEGCAERGQGGRSVCAPRSRRQVSNIVPLYFARSQTLDHDPSPNDKIQGLSHLKSKAYPSCSWTNPQRALRPSHAHRADASSEHQESRAAGQSGHCTSRVRVTSHTFDWWQWQCLCVCTYHSNPGVCSSFLQDALIRDMLPRVLSASFIPSSL